MEGAKLMFASGLDTVGTYLDTDFRMGYHIPHRNGTGGEHTEPKDLEAQELISLDNPLEMARSRTDPRLPPRNRWILPRP
jgi:hypothetical protein